MSDNKNPVDKASSSINGKEVDQTSSDPAGSSTNTAKDVAGRENKGMGMADKLAGAVKDPLNQKLEKGDATGKNY